ncbi:hypothetical protein PCE1_002335 [Barthelona sp. PCE]
MGMKLLFIFILSFITVLCVPPIFPQFTFTGLIQLSNEMVNIEYTPQRFSFATRSDGTYVLRAVGTSETADDAYLSYIELRNVHTCDDNNFFHWIREDIGGFPRFNFSHSNSGKIHLTYPNCNSVIRETSYQYKYVRQSRQATFSPSGRLFVNYHRSGMPGGQSTEPPYTNSADYLFVNYPFTWSKDVPNPVLNNPTAPYTCSTRKNDPFELLRHITTSTVGFGYLQGDIYLVTADKYALNIHGWSLSVYLSETWPYDPNDCESLYTWKNPVHQDKVYRYCKRYLGANSKIIFADFLTNQETVTKNNADMLVCWMGSTMPICRIVYRVLDKPNRVWGKLFYPTKMMPVDSTIPTNQNFALGSYYDGERWSFGFLYNIENKIQLVWGKNIMDRANVAPHTTRTEFRY